MGTQQVAGDQAQVGVEYTLGHGAPMNIKVTRVEYRADRLRAKGEYRQPDKDHKYLVVYFSFHNPEPRARRVDRHTFRYIAVDVKGNNHAYEEHVCRPDTGDALDLELKPGQKVDAFSYIPVPAKGDIEKLIIQSGDDRVLRYALGGKVKPLDTLYADPDDKTGFSAREEFVGKMGTAFHAPLYPWNSGSALDMSVDRIATSSEPVADEKLPEGSKSLVVWLRVKNVGASKATLSDETFSVRARMDDGSAVQSTGSLLHAAAERTLDEGVEIEKGAEVTVRVCLQIPNDATPKALVIAGHLDGMQRWVIPL